MIFDRPPIPTYWTGAQALEVVDFLEQLIHCIWWVHGNEMTCAAQRSSVDADDAGSAPPPPDTRNLPF